MIIKLGSLYSQDIGVGGLTPIIIQVYGGIRSPMEAWTRSKKYAYANRAYMYIAQKAPFLTKGRICAVYIYTL